MKIPLSFIPLILCLFGCASQKSEIGSQTPAVSNPTSALAIMPPRPIVESSSQAEIIENPPPQASIDLQFIFAQLVTNCYLQSSIDLLHWDNRYDFAILTNIAGTNISFSWQLNSNPIPTIPQGFFRAGGDSLP